MAKVDELDAESNSRFLWELYTILPLDALRPPDDPSHDLDDGDIAWMIPRMTDSFRLEPYHWEVLSLEASSDKLLSAETVMRREFENDLRTKLERLEALP